MRMSASCVLLIVALSLISAPDRSGASQKVPISTAVLGNLKIEILRVDQTVLIGDSLIGRSSFQRFGKVYVKIRNVGDFPACAALTPSLEEYRGSELQFTQQLKTGLAHNPQIKNLAAGAEASGYYDFKPSPQKRNYILVLQQRNHTQRCDKPTNAEDAASNAPTARLPL
jgi:hypothetical protein